VLAGTALTSCTPRADIVVTKSADTNDGRCDADCSLREAVIAANAASGADVIRVPTGLYDLTLRGKREDASATGDLDIRGDLVIAPEPDAFVALSGERTGLWDVDDRVLDVHSGAVEVRDLSIDDAASDGDGGLIRNQGALTLVDVVLRNGLAENNGGAIASVGAGPSLTLIRTEVSGNRNTQEGAGIRSSGRLRVEDSIIERNTGGPGRGMGLENNGTGEVLNTVIRYNGNLEGGAELCGAGIDNTGTLVVRGSRVTNNGGDGGAGIRNTSTGVLTVVSSQVRYNRSVGAGGGVANLGGRVLLDATTVAGNEADHNAPQGDSDCDNSSDEEGGGLYNESGGTFELRSAVVAFNEHAAGTGFANDCAGTFIDRGGNTIGDRSGCTLVAPSSSQATRV
jgi:CSLREA domain-containing protein